MSGGLTSLTAILSSFLPGDGKPSPCQQQQEEHGHQSPQCSVFHHLYGRINLFMESARSSRPGSPDTVCAAMPLHCQDDSVDAGMAECSVFALCAVKTLHGLPFHFRVAFDHHLADSLAILHFVVIFTEID